MKRYLLPALLLLFLLCSCTSGFSSLTADNHPRLILGDDDFSLLNRKVGEGQDSVVLMLHEAEMRLAERSVLAEDTLKYEKDQSGLRLLQVSRAALNRIVSCAYAYRFTGDEKYLAHAERDINTVCNFPDWNPSHYLDVAEMSTAVALGYDWLYKNLLPETKAKVESALKSHAFDTAPGQSFYTTIGNWNQVCNSGLTVAALAIYEAMPQVAGEVIETCVASNRFLMDNIYAPDGIYTEGAGYWSYGSGFEALMLTALEDCLGDDYGLSDGPGFDKSGDFIIAINGNTGKAYNFADGSASIAHKPALWYLARHFGKADTLPTDISVIRNNDLSRSFISRLLFLTIRYSLHVDGGTPMEAPKGPVIFSGRGDSPLAVFRTGFDANDLYLGIKGGKAKMSHAHMDAGSFVYEADGVRWAVELGALPYAQAEKELAKAGGKLWSLQQDSYRWDLFRYNNRQHSTITVNGHKFDVNGFAELVSVTDDPENMGATFDLTPVYGGEVASAQRTAAIRESKYLEVRDCIEAPADTAAAIRWTLVTPAEPEIVPDGIILRQNGKSVKLCTSVPDVTWRIWSSDPKDYESRTSFFEPVENAFICGFETSIPAGAKWEAITTLKSQ